ncbi:MAG: hypothetical protein M1813_000708 [Trichoglossum hirsutum]|nr:MAG: hypothetical protein M1813_000708 [Trichoglossum hirsutum]
MEALPNVNIQFPDVAIVPLDEKEAYYSALDPLPLGRGGLRYLADVPWISTGLNHGVRVETGQVSPLFATVLSAYQTHRLMPPDAVAYRIWERTRYILAYSRCEELYLDCIVGQTPAHARRLAVRRYIQEVFDRRDWSGSIHSASEREAAALRVLQRGMRWRELVQDVGCLEVVLLDPIQFLGSSTNMIATIVDTGTDDEFVSFKQYLVSPACGFRDCCLQLSGLAGIISDLADSASESAIRSYLVDEVTRRIKDVFPNSPETARNIPQQPMVAVRLPMNRLQHAIFEIFGFLGSWRPDVGNQPGMAPTRKSLATSSVTTGVVGMKGKLSDMSSQQLQKIANTARIPGVATADLNTCKDPVFNELCEKCSEIFRIAADCPARGAPQAGEGKRALFHDMRALSLSATSGCHLCNLIMSDLDPHLVQYNLEDLIKHPQRAGCQIVAVVPSERWMGEHKDSERARTDTPLITLEEYHRRGEFANNIPLCHFRFKKVEDPSVPCASCLIQLPLELQSRVTTGSCRFLLKILAFRFLKAIASMDTLRVNYQPRTH